MKFEYSLKILLLLALSFTLISFSGCGNSNKHSMSSFDHDADDAEDFEEYISKAKNSASNERFSQADSYLEKARKLGVSSSELSNAKSYVAGKERAYEERIERERQAQLERERQERIAQEARERQASNDASGNAGGSLNCARVSGDYALWSYCEKGDCAGFSSNYGLYTLCESNSANGLSGNYNIWSYLENGNTGGFSGTAYKGAEQNKGSFADRKRFAIYYLRGFVYYNY